MIYQNRLARARALMQEKGVELVLLTHSTDLAYLTGITGHIWERLACLLLTKTQAFFVAPGFELGNLSAASASLLDCHGWKDGEDPFALVQKLVGDATIGAVGRTAPSWVLLNLMKAMPHCEWQSADSILTELRICKDEQEFELLRQVQEKACNGLVKLMTHGLCGLTEVEAFELLKTFCAQEGVAVSGGIVASGPNGALPHHHNSSRVIQTGDPVCIDFVGEEPGIGYQADTTRTFCVGSIPEGFEEVYHTVNRANQAAFEAAVPGTPCEEVDQAARKVIEEAGFGKYFTHRVGHGLGLDVHEHPYLSAGNRDIIRPGYVFSIEPGIYLPGKFGVRIEDQVFVTPDGPVRLTPTHGLMSHDLRICD
ncbi:MAG: M24 family metallopeptidase [Oscillospiraceae bacterium]|jgi:Xaa-Pro dipeptidase